MRQLAIAAVAMVGCRWHFDSYQPRTDALLSDGVAGDGASDDGASGDAIAAVCGDSVVEAGEECDDGGPTAACSGSCQLVDQGPGGTCASPKNLVLARTATGHRARATGNTSLATNGAQSSCTPANTLDESYALVVATAETLSITATPDPTWNLALAVRDASLACNQSTTLCCVDSAAAGLAESSTCGVTTGTVHIVIDASAGNQAGPYVLDVAAP